MVKHCLFLLIFCFLFSGNSYSSCNGRACSNVYIDRIYVKTTAPEILIGTTGDETGLNCNARAGVYVTLNGEGFYNHSQVLSVLLAAQAANKRVLVRIAEGSENCDILYVTLDKQ
jgi:hypothetical protein